MAKKQILFSDEARRAIQRGVDQLANAVKVTLGPKGRNVVVDKKFGSPTITKDGVTVAKEIDLEEPYENMGAQMVKEVASKTSDAAGDGTTTATILAQSIYREGLKNVTSGASPMGLKRGIEKAVIAVVEALGKNSKPIKDKKETAQVATIAANNDAAIGNLLAEAMEKVGKDGVITIEEAKTMETAEQQAKYLISQANAFINSDEFDQAINTAQYIISNLDKNSQEAKSIIETAKAEMKKAAQQAVEDAKSKLGFGK